MRPYDEKDRAFDRALRPKRFGDYIGQRDNVRRVQIALSASRARGEALDHVLLAGPPGLGKTSLSHVIALEAGTKLHAVTGPTLEKPQDAVGLLMKLQPRDVLFIDEIHAIPGIVAEMLYTAMEDFRVDITLGDGADTKAVRMPLPPFTMIGATTRSGMLPGPFRDRFGLDLTLAFYKPEELRTILRANVDKLGCEADESALSDIAVRARGTPRIANKLLRRARDYAAVVRGGPNGRITREAVEDALALEGIDERGLTELDRRVLRALIHSYGGGPAGSAALAASVGEDAETISEVSEPYLLQSGLLARTPRGRKVTQEAYKHLGYPSGVAMGNGNGHGLNAGVGA